MSTINVYFDIGRDADLAAVDVQNRVNQTLGQLDESGNVVAPGNHGHGVLTAWRHHGGNAPSSEEVFDLVRRPGRTEPFVTDDHREYGQLCRRIDAEGAQPLWHLG